MVVKGGFIAKFNTLYDMSESFDNLTDEKISEVTGISAEQFNDSNIVTEQMIESILKTLPEMYMYFYDSYEDNFYVYEIAEGNLIVPDTSFMESSLGKTYKKWRKSFK